MQDVGRGTNVTHSPPFHLAKGDFAPLVESPAGAVWHPRSQPSRTTAPLRDATSARAGGCELSHPKDGWGPPQLQKDKDAR